MVLEHNRTEAPHLGRSILIAPNRRLNLANAGHPLVTIKPKTKLGALALDLAVQSSVAVIQIIATTTYVNMLTALAAPVITFTAPPANAPGVSPEDLQGAYQTFVQQLAVLQGEAANWIATSSGSGGASIFSSLEEVADMLSNTIDPLVQSNFTILQTVQPGSTAWLGALNDTTKLIQAQMTPLTSLQTQIGTLSTNLDTAATTLITATTTGVLQQLLTAYQNEIDALNQDITNCNNTISSDNSKIVGLGFAVGAAITVGLVGLVNIWNPFGWFMMAGGIAGAYFGMAEIEALKGQVTTLTQQIKQDTQQSSQDLTAAQAVSSFAQSAEAAASLNSASQQELNTLIQLCSTLGTDVASAVQDLTQAKQDTQQSDITDAITEWNDVIAAAAFLSGITAYIWPSSIQLANPSSFAATGNAAYLVSNSGTVYLYTSGGNTWTPLPDYSLSVIAAGGTIAGIDGAPANGGQVQPNTYGHTFNVKTYSTDSGAWTTISTFPAAQIATDGSGAIWAINQTVSDRQAYQYTGSGTVWNAVGAMPNTDAPEDIAAYNGTLFSIANNGSGLWYAGSSGWIQVGSATYTSMDANGGWLGLIDESGNGWVVNLQTAGTYAPTAMMTSVSVLAQAPDGDQYTVDNDLNLWHVAYSSSGGPTSTQLRSSVVGAAVSDGGSVYATDNVGDIWILTDLASNTWQQLPALPTS